jgi:hypothetical protein
VQHEERSRSLFGDIAQPVLNEGGHVAGRAFVVAGYRIGDSVDDDQTAG